MSELLNDLLKDKGVCQTAHAIRGQLISIFEEEKGLLFIELFLLYIILQINFDFQELGVVRS